MSQDETPTTSAPLPKAESLAGPTDGELSRIARQAVHQPADPRLDRQLERLGVMEPSEPVSQPGPTARLSVVSGADLERLQARLRRVELILGAVIVAVGIVAVAVAILLLR